MIWTVLKMKNTTLSTTCNLIKILSLEWNTKTPTLSHKRSTLCTRWLARIRVTARTSCSCQAADPTAQLLQSSKTTRSLTLTGAWALLERTLRWGCSKTSYCKINRHWATASTSTSNRSHHPCSSRAKVMPETSHTGTLSTIRSSLSVAITPQM